MDDTSAPPTKRLKTDEEDEGNDDVAVATEASAIDTTTALTIMAEKISALAANQEKLLAENAELVSQVKTLTTQIKHLKQGLTTVNQTLSTINNGQQRLNRVFRDPSDHTKSIVAAAAAAASDSSAMPSLPAVAAAQEEDMDITTNTGEQTPCKNLKGSDNNLYLIDILLSLRHYQCINIDKISKSNYPRDIVRHSGNTSYVKYCLELVEFVSATNPALTDCIRSLADSSIENEETIRNVAEILTDACAEKIEEFDSKKVRKKTAIGFGSRIREYKKKIAQLMGVLNPDQGYTAENVDLIEREEFDSLLASTTVDRDGDDENEETGV
ncbi:hypothetical protein ACHAXN_009357 [Cyclotella atomus]